MKFMKKIDFEKKIAAIRKNIKKNCVFSSTFSTPQLFFEIRKKFGEKKKKRIISG